MRLVVDASTVVAEALRARGRQILAHPDLDLVVAAEAMSEAKHELRKRVALLVERGHLEASSAEGLLEVALTTIEARITVIPSEVYAARVEEAQWRVPRDARDVPTVALALTLGCDIWTGDHDFLRLWRANLDNRDASAETWQGDAGGL